MPQIPGIPESLEPSPGVQMNAPPAQYIEQTTAMIQDAVSKLGADERGALTWIASKSGDKIVVNLAVVARINDRFHVAGWIGKTHGEPISAGVLGRLVW